LSLAYCFSKCKADRKRCCNAGTNQQVRPSH
jgi:hypothetical protein